MNHVIRGHCVGVVLNDVWGDGIKGGAADARAIPTLLRCGSTMGGRHYNVGNAQLTTSVTSFQLSLVVAIALLFSNFGERTTRSIFQYDVGAVCYIVSRGTWAPKTLFFVIDSYHNICTLVL